MITPAGFQPRFPGGKRKAVIMSYDDGSEHDRRLVDLFNRYGLRASFHLNSGKLGQPHHVGRSEVRSLYAGHEVSCHTVNHPDLTQLPEERIRQEIAADRATLEDLSGGPVRGLAYPFGTYDERIIRLLPELGIQYARTANATDGFEISPDFLRWQASCHHGQALDLGRRFLETESDAPLLLYIWGHSYELDGFMTADTSKDWAYMETCCRLLGGRLDIHYATTIELIDYLIALESLATAADKTLLNTAPGSLWFQWRGVDREVKPGARIMLH